MTKNIKSRFFRRFCKIKIAKLWKGNQCMQTDSSEGLLDKWLNFYPWVELDYYIITWLKIQCKMGYYVFIFIKLICFSINHKVSHVFSFPYCCWIFLLTERFLSKSLRTLKFRLFVLGSSHNFTDVTCYFTHSLLRFLLKAHVISSVLFSHFCWRQILSHPLSSHVNQQYNGPTARESSGHRPHRF